MATYFIYQSVRFDEIIVKIGWHVFLGHSVDVHVQCHQRAFWELQSFVVDVSLPEVSREELPRRVQDFLQREDMKFESEESQRQGEQVLFPVV